MVKKKVVAQKLPAAPRKLVKVFWWGDNTGLVIDLPMDKKWLKEFYRVAIGVAEERNVTLQVEDLDAGIDIVHHFGPKDPYALERLQEVGKRVFKSEKEFEEWLDKDRME